MDSRDRGNNRVLIVDDQKEIHDDFVEMMTFGVVETATDDLAASFVAEKAGPEPPELELLHASSGVEACEIIKAGREADLPIAVAYIDVRMPPGIDGIKTVRRVRKIDSDVEIVIMTAYSDRSLPQVIRDEEFLHKVLYIRKPFTREEIQQITLSLVRKWNVEWELAEKRRQLAIGHERLEAVLNATGDAMAMYDVTRRLVFANRGYEKIFGLTESEMKEISSEELTSRFKQRFREPDLSVVNGASFFRGTGDLVEKTVAGQVPRLFYRSISPVNDSGGHVIGDLHVYHDVSREIEVERMKAEVLRLRTELETTYSCDGMVGASALMQQVYALMKQSAESDITVFIQGESGTGKELVAKSFHFNSLRKNGPFLAVNCPAIPEAFIESELFGHEQGAFTEATRQRIGTFERAKGGTVFLDEVGDMPQPLQAKLLRVLQEREIQRVGGTASFPVDVRVIAATKKNLELEVQAGRFREDLFYRLAVFPVSIPPLRDRREDIPLLATHFLEKHAKHVNKSMKGISTAAMRLLLQYDWPGNVRELENVIERAILLETSDVLQVKDLPPRLSPIMVDSRDRPVPTPGLSLAQVERQAMVHALKAAGNNVTRAARTLGINRVTLYRKMKKYSLPAKG